MYISILIKKVMQKVMHNRVRALSVSEKRTQISSLTCSKYNY